MEPSVAVTEEDHEAARRAVRPVVVRALVLGGAGISAAHLFAALAIGVLAPSMSGLAAQLAVWGGSSVLLAVVLLGIVYPIAMRRGGALRAEVLARERMLRADAERREFTTQLGRALEMVDSEYEVFDLVRRGIAQELPGTRAEMLLADSSQAHLTRVADVPVDGETPGCTVGTPSECPAVRSSHTATFPDSEALDACPHLRGRPYGACSAVCVPVAITGRTVGVIHAVGAAGVVPAPDRIGALQTVANLTGGRIGMLRVMAETQLQASTDALTGLTNRRSFENQVRDLLTKKVPLVFVLGDIDHFKDLNDLHGHDTGDRALRLFAQTLKASLRPDDLVCRFGGEEFALALPHCDRRGAVEVVERIRTELELAFATGIAPPVTASFGIVEADGAAGLDEIVALADHTLYRAKQNGRDRVETAFGD